MTNDNVLSVSVKIGNDTIDVKIDKRMMALRTQCMDQFNTDLAKTAYILNELHPYLLELIMHGNIGRQPT